MLDSLYSYHSSCQLFFRGCTTEGTKSESLVMVLVSIVMVLVSFSDGFERLNLFNAELSPKTIQSLAGPKIPGNAGRGRLVSLYVTLHCHHQNDSGQ